jgi:DNA-binding MarR family transcriptional regulator
MNDTLIKSIYLMMDDADRHFFRQFDLSIVQYYSLHWLKNCGKMNLSQMSEKLLCDPAHVTRTVDALERRGLVLRQRAGEDRRVTQVSLTKKGRDLYQVISQRYEKITQERISALSEAEQLTLKELLGKLENRLKQPIEKTN